MAELFQDNIIQEKTINTLIATGDAGEGLASQSTIGQTLIGARLIGATLENSTFKSGDSAGNAIIIEHGADILLERGGNIKFTSVTAPTNCTATLVTTGTGNVDNGTHRYKITYINESGETEAGTMSNEVTVDDTHKQVDLSVIPISTSGSVTSRNIYRTKAGGSDYYLLATISDNVTTTYTDNIADASLGTDAIQRINNTFGKIEIDGVVCGSFAAENILLGVRAGESITQGYDNIFIGFWAGQKNTTGFNNIFIGKTAGNANTTGNGNIGLGKNTLYDNTSGYSNICIGNSAGANNTNGYTNVFIGVGAGYDNTQGYDNTFLGTSAGANYTTGDYNTCIGMESGYRATTANSNVFIGHEAGYYETGSSKLFIDNIKRSNEADGRVKALIYGIFAAATANQKITINGLFNISESKTPSSASDTGTAGDIAWDVSYIYVCTATNTWERVGIATW